MDINEIFQTILKEASAKKLLKSKTLESFKWYKTQVEKLRLEEKIRDRDILSNSTRKKKDIFIGNMYMFKYDPKFKDKLPFYDAFPLIIAIKKSENNSFLGLNLHYLPPILRAKLFDKLLNYRNNDKYDKTTKLILTYKLLKSISQLKAFRPTLKKYKMSKVRSHFIIIHPIEWNIALFLPTEKFEKEKKEIIWKDSRSKI